MRRTSDTADRRLRHLWWLEPASLFALVIGGTMLVALAQSDHAYRLYGTPKYLAAKHLGLAVAAIAAFAIGCRLALRTGRVPPATTSRAHTLIQAAFWITTTLTVLGYVIWAALAVKNGFTLGLLREFLTSNDPEIWETLSKDMFVSWKGVTTATQFGVAAVPLGMWLWMHGQRIAIWPLGLLFTLAGARAILFSERLALVELIVPAAIMGLRGWVLGRPLNTTTQRGLQLAPLGGVAALLLFFGASEYLRSWRYYQHEFDSYASFTVWRIAGYYSTAHNNGAMALEILPPNPIPFGTLRFFWLIPGLSQTDFGYSSLAGLEPAARFEWLLQQYGTPELNNEGGLFQPALDYGVGGFVLFWLASGFVSGRLYRHFLVGTLAGMTLYPLVIIGILETPRFLYLCYTRAFTPLVALAVVLWLVHFRSTGRKPLAAVSTG